MDFFAKVTLKLLINLRTGTSPRHSRQPELIIYMIYIYNNVVVEELDYLVQDIKQPPFFFWVFLDSDLSDISRASGKKRDY